MIGSILEKSATVAENKFPSEMRNNLTKKSPIIYALSKKNLGKTVNFSNNQI